MRKINAPLDDLKNIQLKPSRELCKYQEEFWREKIFLQMQREIETKDILNIDLNDFLILFIIKIKNL